MYTFIPSQSLTAGIGRWRVSSVDMLLEGGEQIIYRDSQILIKLTSWRNRHRVHRHGESLKGYCAAPRFRSRWSLIQWNASEFVITQGEVEVLNSKRHKRLVDRYKEGIIPASTELLHPSEGYQGPPIFFQIKVMSKQNCEERNIRRRQLGPYHCAPGSHQPTSPACPRHPSTRARPSERG